MLRLTTQLKRLANKPVPLARGSSSYYGVLEPHKKGSAGARPSFQPSDLSYIDQIRAQHLLKIRMHLGHHKRKQNIWNTGAIFGFRHNVSIFDINKTWRSLRTLFYGFAEMAQYRSSFFLLAPNPNVHMSKLIDRMRKDYPFKYNAFSSLYMTGYADKKWVDGTFSNWKVTRSLATKMARLHAERPSSVRYARYASYLAGVEGADLMARIVPDFVLVFAADAGAFHEARNLDIPLVGMCDSDMDPAQFLYPVLGNDDSPEALEFMCDVIARAVQEGRKREHEAFAALLVRKIKDGLAPDEAAEPAFTRFRDLGVEDDDDELDRDIKAMLKAAPEMGPYTNALDRENLKWLRRQPPPPLPDVDAVPPQPQRAGTSQSVRSSGAAGRQAR